MDNSQASKTFLETDLSPTAALVLEDGTVFFGQALGHKESTVAELCFNTSLTGYQESLTDPSFAGQIITFTFPHIGNVGTNPDDLECLTPTVSGLVLHEEITSPSNFRSTENLNDWLIKHKISGISGVDTREITKLIREKKAPNALIVHRNGKNEEQWHQSLIQALKETQSWAGLKGMDLAQKVTCEKPYSWTEDLWGSTAAVSQTPLSTEALPHIIAFDFGAKHNILRCLVHAGARVTVVPATTSAQEVLDLAPDGIFLSNGPGDPQATGTYVVPELQKLMATNIPIFGICLGHQLLAQALGAKTIKLPQGHRGSNHPVKNLQTGKIEITSQNHGFAVDSSSLPKDLEETHQSLFDGTNEGLRSTTGPFFSVQYHPEASPGPQDSFALFETFLTNVKKHSS